MAWQLPRKESEKFKKYSNLKITRKHRLNISPYLLKCSFLSDIQDIKLLNQMPLYCPDEVQGDEHDLHGLHLGQCQSGHHDQAGHEMCLGDRKNFLRSRAKNWHSLHSYPLLYESLHPLDLLHPVVDPNRPCQHLIWPDFNHYSQVAVLFEARGDEDELKNSRHNLRGGGNKCRL